MRIALAISLLVISSSAAAQTSTCVERGNGRWVCFSKNDVGQQVQTICRQNGARVYCTSEPSNSSRDGTMLGFFGGINERSIKAKIGGMMAEGRCDDAADYAMRKGKLELVDQIREQCVQK